MVERARLRADDSWLGPDEMRELLTAYGLPLVPERIADGADAMAAAAAELGYPAVVKSAPRLAHKTETGGVALDLEDEAAVHAAAARIGYPLSCSRPCAAARASRHSFRIRSSARSPRCPGGVFAG